MKIRICNQCEKEFYPDRDSRWLCEDCRYSGEDWRGEEGDPMERNMDEQMLINIGMGD